MRECILEEKRCDECGRCNYCDIDKNKLCDNCCYCIEGNVPTPDYRVLRITEIEEGFGTES